MGEGYDEMIASTLLQVNDHMPGTADGIFRTADPSRFVVDELTQQF